MSETCSFARDWQLLKLSRDLRPADRSADVLSMLVEDNDPLVIKKIEEIVKEIGKSDAEKILNRMHPKMEINAILEGILIVSGIAYETADNDSAKEILIKKEMKSSISNAVSDRKISAAYVKGFIESIIPGSEITDKGSHFSVILK